MILKGHQLHILYENNNIWRSIESALVHPHRLQDLGFTGDLVIQTLNLVILFHQPQLHGIALKKHRRNSFNNHLCGITSTCFQTVNLLFDYLWSSRVVFTFSNIFDANGLRTFQDIQKEYNLPVFFILLVPQVTICNETLRHPMEFCFI